MNFAYLDARSVIDSLLHEPEIPLNPIPCELSEEWQKFEETLGEFKLEYTKKRRELNMKLAELEEKTKDIKLLRSTADGFANYDLKAMVDSLIDKYESDEGSSALTLQCREIMGQVNEMQRVLINTMAERCATFTCFICTERLVELFLDPCGHVVCAPCWSRASARMPNGCPGCRSQVRSVKKIYTM